MSVRLVLILCTYLVGAMPGGMWDSLRCLTVAASKLNVLRFSYAPPPPSNRQDDGQEPS